MRMRWRNYTNLVTIAGDPFRRVRQAPCPWMRRTWWVAPVALIAGLST